MTMSSTEARSPESDTCPRIIHFHQFKNGGSTLDSILKRNFGDSFLSFHGSNANANLISSDIALMMAEHPRVQAFTSHHFRLPVDEIPNILPLWMIRHPLDRIPSIFEQERRSSTTAHDDAAFSSLSVWLEEAIVERPSLVCDAQVLFFANGGIPAITTELHLQQAMLALHQAPFCGVVSEFDASMVVLEVLLQPWWPDFSAEYLPQNQSLRDPKIEDRLDLFSAVLSPAVLKAALISNKYDIALFEYSRQLLARAIRKIPDFESRLADFRSRCAALR